MGGEGPSGMTLCIDSRRERARRAPAARRVGSCALYGNGSAGAAHLFPHMRIHTSHLSMLHSCYTIFVTVSHAMTNVTPRGPCRRAPHVTVREALHSLCRVRCGASVGRFSVRCGMPLRPTRGPCIHPTPCFFAPSSETRGVSSLSWATRATEVERGWSGGEG